MKSNGERIWTRDDCLTENGPAGESPPARLPVSSWWQRLDTPHRHRTEVAICYSTGHFATMGRKPDLQRETRHRIPPDSHVEVLTDPPTLVSERDLI